MEGNIKVFENLNLNERIGRFVVSLIVVVFGMQAPWVGTSMFAVANIIAIVLVLTAVIGWDPVRSIARDKDEKLGIRLPYNTDNANHPMK